MSENKKNPLSGVFKGTDPNPPEKPATPPGPPKKEDKPAPPKPIPPEKPAEPPKQPEGKAHEPPKKADEKPKSEAETPKDKAPEKPVESPKPEDKPATQPEPKTEGKPKSEPAADKPPEDEIPPDFSIEPVVTESSMGMVTSIPIDLIDDFENHPYAVRDDDDMKELVNSIKQVGVLEPVVVIPNAKKPGRFEMVSGHRRKHAAKLAGGTKILAVVRNMDRDDAIINMVDSNLKRSNVSPMEKARAYTMRSEALRRKVGRRSKEEQAAIEASGKKPLTADEEIAKESGESKATVQRLKSLTKLEPKLQDMVDDGKLPVTTAADIAQMGPKEQKELADAIEKEGKVPSGTEAKKLKEESRAGTLTADRIAKAVAPTKQEQMPPLKVAFGEDDLRPYFPDPRTTIPDAKRGILEALALWKRAKDRQKAKAEQKDGIKQPATAR